MWHHPDTLGEFAEREGWSARIPERYRCKAHVVVAGIAQQVESISVVSEEQVRGGIVGWDLFASEISGGGMSVIMS